MLRRALVVVIVVLLAFAGVVSGGRPPLGAFSTTGYTTWYEDDLLLDRYLRFHLTAQGLTDGYFNGDFTFEEWGVFDLVAGCGVNNGLMTVSTAQGEAQVRFDGLISPTDVRGSFAVADGNGGYKNLKGQGTFAGNAESVFTVAYQPCGKQTGTVCPDGTCLVFGGDLRFVSKEVRWRLTNQSDEPVTVESITIIWPQGNGPLNQVRLGAKIYQTALNPPWAAIEAGWVGIAKDRQINQHQTKELTFRFENPVDSQPSNYTIWVRFAEGCAATAVAFPSP